MCIDSEAEFQRMHGEYLRLEQRDRESLLVKGLSDDDLRAIAEAEVPAEHADLDAVDLSGPCYRSFRSR